MKCTRKVAPGGLGRITLTSVTILLVTALWPRRNITIRMPMAVRRVVRSVIEDSVEALLVPRGWYVKMNSMIDFLGSVPKNF